MFDLDLYLLQKNFDSSSYLELRKKITGIMGQFLNYLTSVFTGRGEIEKDKTAASSNHVTFADGSFTQAFRGGSKDQASRLSSLRQANRNTIVTYQVITIVACCAHFLTVTWPKLRVDTFDVYQPEGWQMVLLNMVPLIVQVSSISAMMEINKPLPEGAKLTSKNSGLELNHNNFIQSLKVIILIMSVCQISSIMSDLYLWSVVLILPIWCYQLTSRLAQSEYNRHAPSPKKDQFGQWISMNRSKSPKAATPVKQIQSQSAKKDDSQTRATPRTRTKRAVKNIFNGVSDKYHAFEQNVAHQLSQKIFTPLSPRTKMIESS